MSEPWFARLDRGSAKAAAALRARTDVRAAWGDGALWLAGDAATPELERALRCVPGLRRFASTDGRRLAPLGRTVPTELLPELDWRPLSTLLRLRAPAFALAGEAPPPTALRLERDDIEREAAALLVPLGDLARWCDTAPRVRMAPLTFVADDRGRAIVRGRPLPPIPGRALWEAAGVLVPCGLGFDPPLDPASARRVLAAGLDVAPEDLLLVGEEGRAVLPADAWARLGRSAVRATAEGSVP